MNSQQLVPRQTHNLRWHGGIIPVREVERWAAGAGNIRVEVERLDGKPFVFSAEHRTPSIYHTVPVHYLEEVTK